MMRKLFLLTLLLLLISCTPVEKQPAPAQQPVQQESLPPHKVNDISKTPKVFSVWLFIVIDKNMTKEDATKIANHYKKEYSNYPVVIIDMHCDEKYATHDAIDAKSSISDEEYDSHVVYSFFRRLDPPEEHVNCCYKDYGTAC